MQVVHFVAGSTFRNACCNKNVARLDDCDVIFFAMYVNLAIATQVARQVA
jgi:hypothetical protein